MAFPRPSLATIRDRVKGDLRTASGVLSIIRRSFLDVLAKAITGVSHVLHGHIFHVSKQVFIDQAEAEFLDRWGAIYSLARNESTFAQLSITITGTDTTVIPVDQVWKRSDGAKYFVTDEVVISGATTANVISEFSGTEYNLDVSETLTIEAPVIGVDSESVISAIVVEAADTELDEAYRLRIIARIQEPPNGGTIADYKSWALGVSGVTRVWITPNGSGAGTVIIYFVVDGLVPIIPIQAKIDEVQVAVESQQPITARAFTFAPTTTDLDIEVNISPNTTAVQDAIKAEIAALIIRESQVSGTYQDSTTNYTGIISLSKIREAISVATGEDDHVLVSPVADITPAAGGLVVEGAYIFGSL